MYLVSTRLNTIQSNDARNPKEPWEIQRNNPKEHLGTPEKP